MEANPTTGNVLVLHRPERATQAEILREIQALGYLNEPPIRIGQAKTITASESALAEKLAETLAKGITEFALQRLVAAII